MGEPVKQLEKLFDKFRLSVEQAANRIFTKSVLPVLKQQKTSFVAGNGRWWLIKDGKYIHHSGSLVTTDAERMDEWATVLTICGSDVPGLPYSDLGSLMPSYDAATGIVS